MPRRWWFLAVALLGVALAVWFALPRHQPAEVVPRYGADAEAWAGVRDLQRSDAREAPRSRDPIDGRVGSGGGGRLCLISSRTWSAPVGTTWTLRPLGAGPDIEWHITEARDLIQVRFLKEFSNDRGQLFYSNVLQETLPLQRDGTLRLYPPLQEGLLLELSANRHEFRPHRLRLGEESARTSVFRKE